MEDKRSRTRILIDLWLDGILDPQQAAELNQLLADESLQSELNAALKMHADLSQVFAEGLPRLTTEELARLKPMEHSADPSGSRLPELDLKAPLGGWTWMLGSGLGLLLFGFLAFRLLAPGATTSPAAPPPRAIAQITRSASTEIMDRGSKALEVGEVIEFATGMLELEYQSGVRLLFGGPARFRIDSPAMLTLDFGEVSGFVPPAGSGFRIRTPDGVVEDIGTEFEVNVPVREGKTTVAVLKGEVQVFGLAPESKPQRLLEGNQVALSKGSIGEPVETSGPTASLKFDRPSLSLEAESDSYIKGGLDADRNFGESELLMVKLDAGYSEYNRRVLLRFQVPAEARSSLRAARLLLTVCPNSLASDLHPENEVADCLWRFSVGGIWDRYWQPWDEASVSWNNAPGHRAGEISGSFFGPEAPIELGEFSVHRHGVSGAEIAISGPQLLRFLREDADGSVNMIVSRLTGYRWNSPAGNNEDRVVHSFASREHPSLPGPRLELWLDPTAADE